MRTKSKTLVKREEVLGGFDPANYVTERLHATASDGVKVPISIVYRKGFAKDGSRPLLLYGYGSYGLSMDASFQSERLSLLDRGFAYAIAHIRGGQELGREWYESGKLLKKKNTFTDFIACAEHLIREKYTRPDRLFAQGGSAGGLLMGAVINIRPDLFKGIIAQVPFVDVVTTMLDPTIPLTTSEYDEWGNPGDRTYFDYMLSYSPYDNVEAKTLSQHPGDNLAPGFPGAILGARQMGRQAPRDQDRSSSPAPAHVQRRKPRRSLGPLQTLRANRLHLRLPPRPGRDHGEVER